MTPLKQTHRLTRTPEEIIEHQKSQLKHAAQLYEQQFLREMVKAMRKTVSEGDLIPVSQGERIFREQLDDSYVQKWAEEQGVGLADMIYDHIVERYFPHQGKELQRSAIPLKKPGSYKIENSSETNKTTITIEKSSNDKEASAVISPWAGEIKKVQSAPQGLALSYIQHDNGLKSTLAFGGELFISQGRVEAGQTIGVMADQAQRLTWSVEAKG